jgi:hypothetical protein
VRIEGGGHDGARYVVGEGDGGAAPFSLSLIFGRNIAPVKIVP